MNHDFVRRSFLLLGILACAAACSQSAEAPEPDAAATAQVDGGTDAASDLSVAMDSAVDATVAPDSGQDAPTVRYTRDVRPLLEASECGDCHRDILVMDYAWISAPGETWCAPGVGDYGHRYDCFEEHARTQQRRESSCSTDFYHRHGEPCFDDKTRDTVLAWAAGGYLE